MFAAQVARPMCHVRDRGHPVSLGVFAPVGQFVRPASRRRWARQRALVREEFGLDIMRLPSPPSRASGLWPPAPLLRSWLGRRHAAAQPVILHCRGPLATATALTARGRGMRAAVVFDCRGWDGAEYLYRLGYDCEESAPPAAAAAARALHHRQGRAAVESDFVLCVSQAMKRAIVETWAVEEERIAVVPCCAEVPAAAAVREAREAARRDLGLDGKLAIAYSGSLARYQMVEKSLRIVRAIQDMRPDAIFLGLTTDPCGLQAVADEVGLCADRRRILSVPHQEVPRYLSAADAGLLIRGASVLNRVASPVKFAEYLACGVPVIVTESVGDYSELVRERGLGAVLPDAAATSRSMEALGAFLRGTDRDRRRERCRETAERELSWARASETLAAVYDRLREAAVE